MEIKYATSFSHLLRDISEATSRRKESETDYQDLLRKIFETGGVHDTAQADSSQIDDQLTILEANKTLGRELETRNLFFKCCYPEEGFQLSAIPIVGAAGIGKTTLARRIYEHNLLLKHFEIRAWVNVSKQELNLHNAAEQILKLTMGMACSVDDLDEMVRDTLEGRRCLIVFDGVESMADDLWLHMNNNWFDCVDVGSKVLITTTNIGVADLVDNEPFELNQLCPFEARPLYQHLSIDTMVIVKGIPLLLTLVVSMMGCHHKLKKLLSQGEYSDVIFPSTFDASAVILLCIWALPPQLRQCLAFCAVFPKGYVLDREKIINMWVAHGLVKSSREKNLRDIGDSYFHQLHCRSFFTEIASNEYGDISDFQLPGLIHTIMQDFASIVLIDKLGVICSVSEDAAHLSLHSNFAGKHIPEGVRTLILSSTLYSDGSSLGHSLFDFKELQSLDLSCSGIRNLSDDICALKELRYLNLSYTLIERLPDSFMELSKLQTLDLSWCYNFKVLPKGMRTLAYMSHLDLSQCVSLSYLPSGIGFLMSLTSMPLFVLGKNHDSASLGELGLLNKLRGRLEIRNLENVMEISEACNAKLNQKNLYHLILSWSSWSKDVGDCFEILELLQPNQQLKVFDLTGYMSSSFPRWLSSINSLMKISITDCACTELPSLGQLPFLKELQLNRMMNLECIGQEFYGDGISDAFFPSLEQLELYDLPRLLKWSGSDRAALCCSGIPSSNAVLRSLETLTVEGCPILSGLPPLPALPDLILKNCSSTYTVLYSLSSFTSLSSLLINDMEVGQGMPFEDLGRWESLKKLVLCNIRDRSISFYKQKSLAALEHLGILHCHGLTHLFLTPLPSLQKLHIVDCPNLSQLIVEEKEENIQLMELVVEDCPQANVNISFHKFHYLRKLILKNCGSDCSMFHTGELKKLEKLEYLSICGCLKLESEFRAFPWLISHIPCIVVGNHKANFKDSKDLREVLISNELKSEVKAPLGDGFSHGQQKSITEKSIQNVVPIKYREIKKATKNFRRDMMLGKGGFGTVFKGWIHEHNLTAVKPGSGIAVAVKKWNQENSQGHEEWLNEVRYLSHLRHPNLVKLIGYCSEKNNRILVYEFMPNGSLNNHLFTRRHQSLSWATRINVAVGAASGLSFLHDLETPVIHRNVKSASILLDVEYNAKLSDFGHAHDGPTGDMSHITTEVGTFGYLDPDYWFTGRMSQKSDVYGFGVVLLELLSGRPAIDMNQPEEVRNVVQWTKRCLDDKNDASWLVEEADPIKLPKPNLDIDKTNLSQIMDTRLDGQYPYDGAYTVAKLAMQCVSEDPKDRPRMAEVVVTLEQLLFKTF